MFPINQGFKMYFFQQIDILEHHLKCQNHSKSKNEIKTKKIIKTKKDKENSGNPNIPPILAHQY